MNLTLSRLAYDPEGIFSELSGEDGEVLFQTLEHAYKQQDGSYAPKLPPGIYDCIVGLHELDNINGPFQAYEILNVPGHSGILFHVGNYNRDSKGCVLLGTAKGDNMITGSKTAFDKFMKLQDDQSFTLEVVA